MRQILPSVSWAARWRRFMSVLIVLVTAAATGSVAAATSGDEVASVEWVRQLAGVGEESSQSVAVDAAGNVYVTGHFSGTVDFDAGPGTLALTSAGYDDVFLIKLSSLGDVAWAKQWGGVYNDRGMDVAVDGDGNVYATGWFQHIVDFDPGPGVYELTTDPLGASDIFVSKFDTNGDLSWVAAFQGGGDGSGESIAVDSSGSVFVSGGFLGTVDFDPGVGEFTLTSAGSNDAFVAELSAGGTLEWANRWGISEDESALGVAVDGDGYVYTTGYFMHWTVDFDPGPGTFELTSMGMFDSFVSKFDASGNFEWAIQVGGPGSEFGHGIAVSSSGDVYSSGSFGAQGGPTDFDPGPGEYLLESAPGFPEGDQEVGAPSEDAYVLKLDSTGSFLWARAWGGLSGEAGLDIAVDSHGNSHISGRFGDTVDFDPGSGELVLTTPAAANVFVSKFDDTGSLNWAAMISGPGEHYGRGVAVSVNGDVYAAGFFTDTADFDPGVGTLNLTSSGSSDAFVWKLGVTAAQWPFVGFFQPVDNLPVVNLAQAGSAIPIRFGLGGDMGLDIFAPSYPNSVAVDCASGAPIDAIEQTTTAGSSSLSYEPGGERYVYVWKTQKEWAGSCRELTVKLVDGSEHTALFRFR